MPGHPGKMAAQTLAMRRNAYTHVFSFNYCFLDKGIHKAHTLQCSRGRHKLPAPEFIERTERTS